MCKIQQKREREMGEKGREGEEQRISDMHTRYPIYMQDRAKARKRGRGTERERKWYSFSCSCSMRTRCPIYML